MIAPIPEKPIKDWKDLLIRFGIPIAIFSILLYTLFPIMTNPENFVCDIESKCNWLGGFFK